MNILFMINTDIASQISEDKKSHKRKKKKEEEIHGNAKFFTTAREVAPVYSLVVRDVKMFLGTRS